MASMTAVPLWLDTDTAGDDITAIILAVRHPGSRVVGISTVAGNVSVEVATRNALWTLQLLRPREPVPVYPGCARPLRRALQPTTHIQGPEGVGRARPPARLQQRPQTQHAVHALLEASRTHPGLHIVALGPLTNLAVALQLDPHLPRRVARLVIMGGTLYGRGNQTPLTEYNFWQDPEAAYRVLHAGWPITLVPWETVLHDAVLPPEREPQWRARGSALVRFFFDVHAQARAFDQRRWGVEGSLHPDGLTVALALEPHIALETQRLYMTVELEGRFARGMTVPDPYGLLGQSPNVDVVVRAHRERFLALLEASLLEGF